jgi:hypothetical protein
MRLLNEVGGTVAKDYSDGGRKVWYYETRPGAELFIVAKINEDGAATCGVTAVNIAPAVAHHPTASEIESESSGGIEQHSRRGFAPQAGRRSATRVVADLNVVNSRYEPAQMCMHSLDHGLRLGATSDIGLVGGDDQHEAGRFQAFTAFRNTVEQCEFLYCGGWVRFAVVYDRTVQGAVAVEKNSGPECRHDVRRHKNVRKAIRAWPSWTPTWSGLLSSRGAKQRDARLQLGTPRSGA